MLWLYRFLSGYVTVLFSGEFCEKILNLTAKNRISLWNSRLTKKGIESCILAKDFKKLHKIIRDSDIRVHILKKHGIPFKTAKYNKRIGLFAGAVLFFAFLKIMSGFIWIIDVTGNETVKTEDILAACNKIGIKEGIKQSKINPKTERERLLLEIDSLAWASLNIESCRLTINVSETKNKENNSSAPCNLKAKADGIIKKIDVVSGNCVVKTGDAVKSGDVLVSGIIERESGTQFVRSAGTVIAETTRNITVNGNYKTKKTLESGKTKTKKVLELFTIKIPLFLGSETDEYTSKTSVKALKLFGQQLPIRIYDKKFSFLETYEITLNREQLCEQLEKELAENLKKEGIKNYNVLNREFTDTDGGIKLTALISAEENIALETELLVTPQTEETP